MIGASYKAREALAEARNLCTENTVRKTVALTNTSPVDIDGEALMFLQFTSAQIAQKS